MRDRARGIGLIGAGIAAAIVGYRMGSTGGLLLMLAGVLAAWFVAHDVVWRIPSIDEVVDRGREDGLDLPRDTREWDPDIRQDRHIHNIYSEGRQRP